MQQKAKIFNIQKFSIHDGPGIRTTVFFKSCPMKCPWCSNPESQSYQIQMTWDNTKCINCRKCEGFGVEFLKDKKKELVNKEGFYPKEFYFSTKEEAEKCIKICPTSAISYEGYDLTLEEIMEKIMDDLDFYEESGGGVTLSGGEVLMQKNAAVKLLKMCKDKNISTAAETTCFTSKENFKEFLENLDILLCDIKHYDKKIHDQVIGGNLDLIHQNIRYATSKKNLRVIGRIPVIPGFNYSKKDAYEFVKLIKDLGINEVNLLAFHKFGENKYQSLNKIYEYKDYKNLDKNSKEFKEFEKIFKDEGLVK